MAEPYEPGKNAHPIIVALEQQVPGWSWIPDYYSSRVLLLHRDGFHRWLRSVEVMPVHKDTHAATFAQIVGECREAAAVRVRK